MIRKSIILAIFGIFLFTVFTFNTHTATLPTLDQEIILYSNQANDDLKQTFEQAISEAKESITVIIYSLVDKTLISSLRKRAEQGLSVTVICDPVASVGVEKKLGPKVKTYKRRGTGIMHMKILVTDQNRVWIGSANMTTQSLRVHGNVIMGFYSPELALYLEEKAHSMIRTGLKRDMIHRQFQIDEQNIDVWFLPDNRDAIMKVKHLIQTAKKTIKVAMFTWTRIDLAEELIDAHSRGIQVEVALDRNSSNGVSAKVAKLLKSDGIPVYLNSGSGLLHHKLMIVDDETLVIGSANWTLAAFEKNNDCFIVLDPLSASQCQKLKEVWETILAEAS